MPSTDTTIERAYFHLGNGGLRFDVVEHEDVREAVPLTEDSDIDDVDVPRRVSTHYTMQVSLLHYGAKTSFEFDLGSMEVVGWFHEVTGRLMRRMQQKTDQARSSTFDYHRDGDARVEDGQEVEYSFRCSAEGLVRFDPSTQCYECLNPLPVPPHVTMQGNRVCDACKPEDVR